MADYIEFPEDNFDWNEAQKPYSYGDDIITED